jgi:hypothetical protein
MISLAMISDCRKGVLPLAVVALFFWFGAQESPNFFYGVPIESTLRANVHPTPYPPSFRIQFDTNISRQESASASASQPLNSMLYYDWTIPAQRIDHGAGAYECVRFYNVTTHGCQLYFLNQGMYRVISPDANPTLLKYQPCCLDISGLGPPPPDWAQQANPSFQGLKHDSYSGFDAYEFVFDNPPGSYGDNNFWYQQSLQLFGTNLEKPRDLQSKDIYDDYHTSREVHDGNPLRNGIPLTFTFPSKAKGLQDFHFDPNSLVVGHQDADLFRLPEGCEDIICDQSSSTA